jgi:hypothetical protein
MAGFWPGFVLNQTARFSFTRKPGRCIGIKIRKFTVENKWTNTETAVLPPPIQNLTLPVNYNDEHC